ncbi:hypothetical protein QBE55_12145 [Eubacteriales bacterium mix99]
MKRFTEWQDDGCCRCVAAESSIWKETIRCDGILRGVFRCCFDFCRKRACNIRMDTHSDNLTMQHVVEKDGFERCGIIYEKDGSPRIAYQYTATWMYRYMERKVGK